MKDNRLIVHAPLNPLSLGQVSLNILRELYRRKIQVNLFPRGNVDLSAYKLDPQFGSWIERSLNERLKKFDRTVPTLSVWHINGSELKPSDHQYLLTFHETDSPTEHEVNIVNQQDHVFFSSNWSVDNFKLYGARNVGFLALALDEDFSELKGVQLPDEITHWVLVGKWESRKGTAAIIKEWAKRYGGNKKHQLTTCVDNPFLDNVQGGVPPEVQEYLLYSRHNVIDGKPKPFNVNILPRLKTNAEMNKLYNSADIDLSGFSGAEGWGIPAHTATALGKWSIVSNCTAHKDWATKDNAILVEPNGMRPVYDGVFFQPGSPFSQGNIYSFTPEQLQAAFEVAEKRAKTPNPAGRELAKRTYKHVVDEILEKIQ